MSSTGKWRHRPPGGRQLGVNRNTAQAALTQCRAEQMADVMEQRGITAAQAAAALGYPAGLTRSVSTRAPDLVGWRVKDSSFFGCSLREHLI
ncbi:hypothetical protein ABZ722_38050 [Streptomyces longwoodensis]|uniref:hypothetical protein n=1 Tax=Streptomyces longwoodensis TaxID=68231 RepID=UPI0033F78C04